VLPAKQQYTLALDYEGDATTEIVIVYSTGQPRSAKGVRPRLEVTDGSTSEAPILKLNNYSTASLDVKLITSSPDQSSTTPPAETPKQFGAPCQDLPDRHDCDEAHGLVCLTIGDGGPNKDGFCSKACDPTDPYLSCPDASAGLSYCYHPASDGKTYCGILCGAQYGKSDDCPDGLTCKDTDSNGQNDTCMR
jgi:hypothetical protein